MNRPTFSLFPWDIIISLQYWFFLSPFLSCPKNYAFTVEINIIYFVNQSIFFFNFFKFYYSCHPYPLHSWTSEMLTNSFYIQSIELTKHCKVWKCRLDYLKNGIQSVIFGESNRIELNQLLGWWIVISNACFWFALHV